ncbi:hypothetical protein SAICODRAFT_4582 [Saitoella complicata NRRL Y-17804]|uniref:uncharacterized protein n=1 Tax=Saitoella complicata (strain BCRC 22490 / CBS 7301 / JCM 7358 / NBRC 10748 / NRRL Y-17804) TaxID=698492 RepID=UPI0008672FC2|nr:uncharacterized protein SAICODRAFT_4582 [Saitoella complicata NRRL Y-17804]ODQ56401.1 hypothetical protein SAICODRAFT_4582 [Saitoella complicata NRRL Y-17804]
MENTRYIITPLKVIGTVSLGAITGSLAALSFSTVPAMLGLPTSESVPKALHVALKSTKDVVFPLQLVSATSFLAAFALSPRSGRHPYLLYCATAALSLTPYAKYLLKPLMGEVMKVDGVNGEQTKESLVKWKRRNYGRVVIAAIGTVFAIIGGHGEGLY